MVLNDGRYRNLITDALQTAPDWIGKLHTRVRLFKLAVDGVSNVRYFVCYGRVCTDCEWRLSCVPLPLRSIIFYFCITAAIDKRRVCVFAGRTALSGYYFSAGELHFLAFVSIKRACLDAVATPPPASRSHFPC